MAVDAGASLKARVKVGWSKAVLGGAFFCSLAFGVGRCGYVDKLAAIKKRMAPTKFQAPLNYLAWIIHFCALPAYIKRGCAAL